MNDYTRKDGNKIDIESAIFAMQQEIDALKRQSLAYPLDPTSRRIVNRDLPVMKRKTGDVWTVEINDREEDWDFGTSTGSGTKSVTFIVGPASNSDSAGYDYTTDGTADEVQIQAAIDALPATGGSVFLREGTYTLSDGVASSKTGVHLFGTGSGSILKAAASWTADTYMVGLSGVRCRVDHLKFDGNRTDIGADSPCRWLACGGTGSVTSHCEFIDGSVEGLYIDFPASISQSYIETPVSDVSLPLALRGRTSDCYINCGVSGTGVDGSGSGVFIGNYLISGDASAAVHIFDADVVEGNYFQTGDTSESIFVLTAGSVNSNMFITGVDYNGGSVVDDCQTVIGNTFYITPATGATPIIINDSYTVTGNYIESFATTVGHYAVLNCFVVVGNWIYGSGTPVRQPFKLCSGNILVEFGAHGIGIGNHNVSVTGNILENPAPQADNTYSGIYFLGAYNHCIITNNLIQNNSGANDLKYGIEEITSCDYNIIEHNSVVGAQTAQINTVGANTISANNITT